MLAARWSAQAYDALPIGEQDAADGQESVRFGGVRK